MSIALIALAWVIEGQDLKPYTIGAISNGNIQEAGEMVKLKLKDYDFEVIGSYNPVNDPNRLLIAFTSRDIKAAASKVGGLTGFAMAWRVALTTEENGIVISYTTPEYWGNAYFTNKYSKVSDLYKAISKNIEMAIAECGNGGGEQFGSKKGLEPGRLQRYRYKVLMPQFDDTEELEKFNNYADAVATIDANLESESQLTKVYSVELKDKKIKLYGIGLSGEKGEGKFMPKIDISTPKHTAFLPYEILVVDNKVHMLHGRYRIALSFPDLSMGTFMKIVSTPGDIEDLMKLACRKES